MEDKPKALTERKVERQQDDVEIVDDDHFDGLAAYYADGDKVLLPRKETRRTVYMCITSAH